MSRTQPELAPAIVAYIAAANTGDLAAIAHCFAEDANVFDEGQHQVGPAAITRWVADTGRRYQPRVEVQNVQHRTGKVLVDNVVSGNFPGSPLALRYTFRLNAQGKISRLDISL